MGTVHVVANVSPGTDASGPEIQLNSTRVDPIDFTEPSGMGEDIEQVFTAQMVEMLSDSGIATWSGDAADGRATEFSLSGRLSQDGDGRLTAHPNIDHASSGMTLWSGSLVLPFQSGDPSDARFAAHAAGVLNCVKAWRNPCYASAPETLQNYARYGTLVGEMAYGGRYRLRAKDIVMPDDTPR